METRLENIRNVVTEQFKWLQEITGCPIEKEIDENVRSLSMTERTYADRKSLFGILKSVNAGNWDTAFMKCDALTRSVLKSMPFAIGDDDGPEACERIADTFRTAGDYLGKFIEFRKAYYPVLVDRFVSTGMVTRDDVTLDNVADVALEIEDMELSGVSPHLHTYMIRKGEHPEDFSSCPFETDDAIVCSDSLDLLLQAAKSSAGEEAHVTFTLKIEPIIDYSYFLVFIRKGDTVIAVTDRIEFSNPHTAVSSRNPRRRSEGRENSTGFPYRIIDDIIEWRGETTDVAKTGQEKAEVYVKKLSDYFKGAGRLIIMNNISGIIRNIGRDCDRLEEISTFDRMLVSRKLIGTSVDMQSESFAESFEKRPNEDEVEAYYGSWIWPEQEKTTLPAPVIRDLDKIAEFRGDVLVTEKGARKMADYFVAKREADSRSSLVWDYYSEHSDSELYEFSKLLTEKAENMFPYIFSGDEVSIADVRNLEKASFSMNKTDCRCILAKTFRGTKEEKDEWFSRYTFNEIYPSSRTYVNTSYGKTLMVFDGKCMECGAGAVRKGVRVSFKHYKFICAMLGLEREDLPQTFRNYMSWMFVPYKGNSILDDINPMHLVTDPLSEKRSNGISVIIPLCGNCIRKYAKMYRKWEKSLVVYDSEKGEVVDVIEYNPDTYAEDVRKYV